MREALLHYYASVDLEKNCWVFQRIMYYVCVWLLVIFRLKIPKIYIYDIFFDALDFQNKQVECSLTKYN